MIVSPRPVIGVGTTFLADRRLDAGDLSQLPFRRLKPLVPSGNGCCNLAVLRVVGRCRRKAGFELSKLVGGTTKLVDALGLTGGGIDEIEATLAAAPDHR